MKKKNFLGLWLVMLISLFSSQTWAVEPVYTNTDLSSLPLDISSENTVVQLLNSKNAYSVAVEYTVESLDDTPQALLGFSKKKSLYYSYLYINKDGIGIHQQGYSLPYGNATLTGKKKIVYVFSGTYNSKIMYVDGEKVGQQSKDYSLGAGSSYAVSDALIGGYKDNGVHKSTNDFKGTIHSVRFYNSALSAADVAALEWPGAASTPTTYGVTVEANGLEYTLIGADDLAAVEENTTLKLSNIVVPDDKMLVSVKWNGTVETPTDGVYSLEVTGESTLTFEVADACLVNATFDLSTLSMANDDYEVIADTDPCKEFPVKVKPGTAMRFGINVHADVPSGKKLKVTWNDKELTNDGTVENDIYYYDFTVTTAGTLVAAFVDDIKTYAVTTNIPDGVTYELFYGDNDEDFNSGDALPEGEVASVVITGLPNGKEIESVTCTAGDIIKSDQITPGTVAAYYFEVTAAGTVTVTLKDATPVVGGGLAAASCYPSGTNYYNYDVEDWAKRYLTSITMNVGGSASLIISDIETSGTNPYYHDYTTGDNVKVLEVVAGTEVTPNISWSGNAMHGFMFVDYSNDGVFSDKANTTHGFNLVDGIPVAGSEVVSFTRFEGKDSKGGSDGDGFVQKMPTMPSFVVPATTPVGDYRVRYKIDWSSLETCGTGNNFMNNGGSMVDFILRVTEPTYVVTVATPDNVTCELFYGEDGLDFSSGDALPEGTTANVVITAVPDDKEIESVTWSAGEITAVEEGQLYPGAVAAYYFEVTDAGTVTITLKDKASAKEYIYRAEELRFTGSVQDSQSLPTEETAEVIEANALTIAIDYTLDADDVVSAGNTYGLALTTASDMSTDTWATAAIIAWGAVGQNNFGMTLRYNENGGQISQGNESQTYLFAGEHVKLVYVLTESGYEYYWNGKKIKSGDDDLRFKTLVPNANCVTIGAIELANEYKYIFNGTIHSITYYGKGDKNLTEEQFNALFPAPAVELCAVDVSSEHEDYTITLDGKEVTDLTKVAKGSTLTLQLGSVPATKQATVKWGEGVLTPNDNGAYEFTVNNDGVLTITLATKQATVTVETTPAQVTYTLSYWTAGSGTGTTGTSQEVFINSGETVPMGTQLWVKLPKDQYPASTQVTVTWNDVPATLSTTALDPHSYYFTVNESGTLKISVNVFDIAVAANKITYQIVDEQGAAVDNYTGILSNTTLKLKVNKADIAADKDLKVTWGADVLTATEVVENENTTYAATYLVYTFTVDGNKTLTLELVNKVYTLTVNIEGGHATLTSIKVGETSYDNGAEIPAGARNIVLTFAVEAGYKIESIKDDAPIPYDYTQYLTNSMVDIYSLSRNTVITVKVVEDADAIEGVDADAKAIYYVDGVVYNQAGEIAIYDVNGHLIVRTSETTVDVRDLAKGLYIVRSADKVVRFVK